MHGQWVLVLLGIAMNAWSCSSLEVGKIVPGSPPKGIPYQLTRSTFVVKIDPPTGPGLKPVYTLNQVVVPDPDQKFWINASPAFLAKTSLKLTFGQRGELTNTVTTVEEQIVPTIKALGEFAVTALGAAAKFAAADQKTDVDEVINLLVAQTTIIESLKSTTQRAPDCPPSAPCPVRAQDCVAKGTCPEWAAHEEMKERMKELKRHSPQEFLDQFYPISEVEIRWLRSVGKQIEGMLKDQPQDYTDALSACTNNSNCAAFLKRRKADIGKFADESTPESLDRLEETLKVQLKDTCRTAEEITTLQTINGLMTAVIEKAKALQSDRRSLRARKEIIDSFANMSEKEWRHRLALKLEVDIQKEEHALILSGQTAEPASLIDLRKRLALCIGATAEAEREAAIRGLLVKLGSASSQILGQSEREVPLMEEYQRARQELEALLAVIKVKRDALKPEKTSVQLVSREITPALIWWAENDRVDPATVRTRLLTNGPNPLPDFVVVIERGMTP